MLRGTSCGSSLPAGQGLHDDFVHAVYFVQAYAVAENWIPACAGMTEKQAESPCHAELDSHVSRNAGTTGWKPMPRGTGFPLARE